MVDVVSVSKNKIANGRHHRHEPDLWLQLQTAVAAHILDLVKRKQPASEGDTRDGSTPSVKMTRPFKTLGPSGCLMTRHLLQFDTSLGASVACGLLSDTRWELTQWRPLQCPNKHASGESSVQQ
jgi:hypothetical protein